MGTDRETPQPGLFSTLFAVAFVAAVIGAIITFGVYNLWYWVIRPDLAGKQWVWLIEPPGPFDSRWWDVWLWVTGILFILYLPKAVVTMVRSRRRQTQNESA